MEKQLEIINGEYDLYELEEDLVVMDISDVANFIFDCSEDITLFLRDCASDKKSDEVGMRARCRFGRFASLLGHLSFDEYYTDHECCTKQIALGNRFHECFNKLYDALDDENIDEVYRLARFTWDKYESASDSIDEDNDITLKELDGVYVPKTLQGVDVDAFMGFFDEKVTEVATIGAKEFVK